MDIKFADLVMETTEVEGTGAISLDGAKDGHFSFADSNADASEVAYVVTDGVDVEVIRGVLTHGTPDTLSVVEVKRSTNADAKVNWGAGEKDVYQVADAAALGIIGHGGFDYSETTDPTTETNPAEIGATWINTTSGEIFVCIDNTADENEWMGQLGTEVVPISSDWGPGDDYDAMVAAGNYDETTDTGYMGEVSHTDLTSGDDLALDIGLSGTGQHSEAGWLKFFIGKDALSNPHSRRGETAKDCVVFVAKKPFQNDVSWDDIYDAAAVFGTGDSGPYNNSDGVDTTQDAQVVIDGKTYIVRLLTGAEENPFLGAAGDWDCEVDIGGGSEWNELVYRIHQDVWECPGPDGYDGGPQVGANWATMSDADIVVESGDGRASWCQETMSEDVTQRVPRGSTRLSRFYGYAASTSSAAFGWRPVLELVQE